MTPRLKKLTDKLSDLDADAMLVTDEINVGYLSGFTGDSSYLFVQPNNVTIISDGRYKTQIASCLLYTSPSPRDGLLSRMPSSA